MTRTEIVAYEDAYWYDRKQLLDRLDAMKNKRADVLARYADEQAGKAGYVKGRPYTFNHQSWNRATQSLSEPTPTVFFYDHATVIPSNGTVVLHFAKMKKDGTPALVMGHTEYLTVKD